MQDKINPYPTVEGSTDNCTIIIAPVTCKYVQITVNVPGKVDITRTVQKNRWVNRTDSSKLSEEIATDVDCDVNMVLAALKDALVEAMLRWNWRSFVVPETESALAPSYRHLESLTDVDEYSDLPSFPSTGELRDLLHEHIFDALREQHYVVIESPTGSGKSFTNATQEWRKHPGVTGGKQVIQLSPTKESRDQAAEESDKSGVKHFVLLGREEACPVAAGEYDDELSVNEEPASEWLARKCNLHGFTFSEAKALLIEKNDQDLAELPCCEGDDKCRSLTQWESIRDSLNGEPEYDVIHATHQFAFVPSLRYETNLLIDELPSFAEIGPGDPSGGKSDDGPRLTNSRIWDSVTAFLRDAGAPIETASELVTVAKREGDELGYYELSERYPELYDAFRHRPNRNWYTQHPKAHTAARVLTRVLWDAARQKPDANGRRAAEYSYRPPNLSMKPIDSEVPNQQIVSMVLNESDVITTLRIKPDLDSARTVIGFDAHPVEQLWKRNIGEGMSVDKLMTDEERQHWRRFERRLCVIRMGRGTYSYTKAKRFDKGKVNVIINSLREQYGESARTAIVASSVEGKVETMLKGAGVPNPETMHPGDVESRNDFKGETIGQVYGCIDPGDDYILDILAELGLDAQPERTDTDCSSCSGKGCSNCDYSGKQRAFGRGFVGPNTKDASDILASVRENQVAQSIGRYAREADNPDDWAVVFARTDAIPKHMVDFYGPTVWSYGDKQRAATTYLSEQGEATLKEIADWITNECEYVDSCTKEHVRQTMSKHVKHGHVSVSEGAGYYGADLYRWEGDEVLVTAEGVLDFQMEGVQHPDDSPLVANTNDGIGIPIAE